MANTVKVTYVGPDGMTNEDFGGVIEPGKEYEIREEVAQELADHPDGWFQVSGYQRQEEKRTAAEWVDAVKAAATPDDLEAVAASYESAGGEYKSVDDALDKRRGEFEGEEG